MASGSKGSEGGQVSPEEMRKVLDGAVVTGISMDEVRAAAGRLREMLGAVTAS